MGTIGPHFQDKSEGDMETPSGPHGDPPIVTNWVPMGTHLQRVSGLGLVASIVCQESLLFTRDPDIPPTPFSIAFVMATATGTENAAAAAAAAPPVPAPADLDMGNIMGGGSGSDSEPASKKLKSDVGGPTLPSRTAAATASKAQKARPRQQLGAKSGGKDNKHKDRKKQQQAQLVMTRKPLEAVAGASAAAKADSETEDDGLDPTICPPCGGESIRRVWQVSDGH